MYKLKKILAPVDLSNLSKLGLRYALDIAAPQDAEVIVYHTLTVEETPYPQGAEEWVAKQTEVPKVKKVLDRRKKQLERFVVEEFGDLNNHPGIRLEVEIGTPYKKIVDKASQEAADMIVMSTHGRTGVMHMLIGSVTERVIRRAPCPVLAVPPPQKSKSRPRKGLAARLLVRSRASSTQ
ncbi:MAG TPA: universal stress protein [Candidatus Eisenbacteria bacterium]|nr:universal stress protein [Candidatus Eisenbacteria bacterium]